MLTISQSQKEFIDLMILDTYHSFSEDEQIELDESEDQGENEIEERQLQSFRQLSSPEELHYLMQNWNWDDGEEIPNLVLNSLLCDRGTALMIYWMLDPDYYYTQFNSPSGVPDFQQDSFDMLKNLEARLMNNEFRVSRIKFAPSSYASATERQNPYVPEPLKQESAGDDFEHLVAFA